MQTKSEGNLALIEAAKIDHICSKLKGLKYYSILDIWSEYHPISLHPDSRLKTAFNCPYRKFLWKRVTF